MNAPENPQGIRHGEVIHFISAAPDGKGNVTACGFRHTYPMRGNGWRAREVTCPDCDRIICDHAHAMIAQRTAAEA
ncbi:MAG: hypothetical protein CL804_03630 [Citromicrobium sp.]|nr:hypothetical protein [Citromicrobium sp.]MAO03607.1 hypothetical protein [Citromicrobium sp.]|tara:strand:+ start:721 stop:948 length:228 start_codon:yes stop_codon:yes gene_type:complete